MKRFLQLFFTWWNSATLSLRLFTWRRGEFVGEDAFGNRYYRAPSAVPRSIPERRWVIYNGYAEASRIPPAWHGWMHHTVDRAADSRRIIGRMRWEKPHLPNLTGTSAAFRPPGSTLASGRRPKATGDYKAWVPGDSS